jgi:ParB family chromosome partitioning protein
MIVKDIPLHAVEVSEFNTREDLLDGQHDSSVEDLARSIERQGLLSPITVLAKPDGRYALIAGQRRLLACKHLGWSAIPAIVREDITGADATAISLVENVHRADMNPRDKAAAFKALLDKFGDLQTVHRETGVGLQTIRKYIQLLALAPELQERLAAGEAKNTEALAGLAQRFEDPGKQLQVWERVQGFTQEVQKEILKRVDPELDNLGDLVDQAAEGAFDYHVVHNCPFDCPTIPDPLKEQVARMISEFERGQVADAVRARLGKRARKRR